MPQAAGQVMAPFRDFTIPHTRGSIATPVLVAVWLILTMTAGFRWLGTGYDYHEYATYYIFIPPLLSLEDTRFEPGFHLVAWFFRHKIGLSFDQFTVILVGTSLGIKFYLFRKYLAHPLLAVLAYILIFYGIHEYTQIRAAIALAFGYWAIHLLLSARWRWAALLLVLSLTFHFSAILLIPAYLASQFIRGNLATILIAAGTVIVFLLSDLIYDYASIYLTSVNPLLQSYLDNSTTDINSLRLGSINNLLYMASLASAVAFGWFNLGRYHSTFLTMAIGSMVVLALFAASPVVGQRAKEVLFVAAIFMNFRAPLSNRTLPTVALFFVTGTFIFYLQLRNGLLVF